MELADNQNWKDIKNALQSAFKLRSASNLSFEELYRSCYSLIKDGKEVELFNALTVCAKDIISSEMDKLLSHQYASENDVEKLINDLRDLHNYYLGAYKKFQKTFMYWKIKGGKEWYLESLADVAFKQCFTEKAFHLISDLLLQMLWKYRQKAMVIGPLLRMGIDFLFFLSAGAKCKIGRRANGLNRGKASHVEFVFDSNPFTSIFVRKLKDESGKYYRDEKEKALKMKRPLIISATECCRKESHIEAFLGKYVTLDLTELLVNVWTGDQVGLLPSEDSEDAAIFAAEVEAMMRRENKDALLVLLQITKKLKDGLNILYSTIRRSIHKRCYTLCETNDMFSVTNDIILSYCNDVNFIKEVVPPPDVHIFLYHLGVSYGSIFDSTPGICESYAAFVVQEIQNSEIKDCDASESKLKAAKLLFDAIPHKTSIICFFIEYCMRMLLRRNGNIHFWLDEFIKFVEEATGDNDFSLLKGLVERYHGMDCTYNVPNLPVLDVLLLPNEILQHFDIQSNPSRLPDSLSQLMDEFSERYATQMKHQRKICFLEDAGFVEMSAKFDRTYSISCSVNQCAILLKFNENNTLSFEDLRHETTLEVQDFCTVLNTLLTVHPGRHPNDGLLKKVVHGKKGLEDSTFAVNPMFSAESDEIVLRNDLIVRRRAEIQSKADSLTEHRTKAAICKIMKTSKQCHYKELFLACRSHLNRDNDLNSISFDKVVETLIEMKYLEWSEENSKLLIWT